MVVNQIISRCKLVSAKDVYYPHCYSSYSWTNYLEFLFADDVARLSASEEGLQEALNQFDEACSAFGMKISAKKTELMVVSRESKQSNLHLNNNPSNQVNKFKYLGVQFTSDGKQDGEIDRRIGAASGILRSL
jgi:hypothetical protein